MSDKLILNMKITKDSFLTRLNDFALLIDRKIHNNLRILFHCICNNSLLANQNFAHIFKIR